MVNDGSFEDGIGTGGVYSEQLSRNVDAPGVQRRWQQLLQSNIGRPVNQPAGHLRRAGRERMIASFQRSVRIGANIGG
jgi:hypothetical protein